MSLHPWMSIPADIFAPVYEQSIKNCIKMLGLCVCVSVAVCVQRLVMHKTQMLLSASLLDCLPPFIGMLLNALWFSDDELKLF